jgi:hypothetical protein
MHQLVAGIQFCILPNSTHFVLDENPGLINKMVIFFDTVYLNIYSGFPQRSPRSGL